MEICCMTQGTQTGALEVWEQVGGGRKVQGRGKYVHLGLIHVDVQQKSNQYCKAIINQLKINFFKKEVPAQQSKWRK